MNEKKDDNIFFFYNKLLTII